MAVLTEVAEQLRALGRRAEVALQEEPPHVTLTVYQGAEVEFAFVLRGDMAFAYTESSDTSAISGKRYTYEGYIGGHQLDHTINKVTREEIIEAFMAEYRHVRGQRGH